MRLGAGLNNRQNKSILFSTKISHESRLIKGGINDFSSIEVSSPNNKQGAGLFSAKKNGLNKSVFSSGN